jgi:hypothetical protein
MTLLEEFRICNGGSYQNTKSKVSWKIVGDTMYFQPSSGAEDWWKNITIIPWLTKIGGKWMLVHLGFHLAWLEVKDIVERAMVKRFSGYSHGGPLAARAAAHRGLPADVFGCPNFLLCPSDASRAIFDEVHFYQNPNDIMTRLPSGYTKGRYWQTLGGRASMPPGYDPFQWLTGHTPAEYEQRLAAIGE